MKLTTKLLQWNVLDFDGNPIGDPATTVGKAIRIALNSPGGPGKVVDPAEKDRIFDLSVSITTALKEWGNDVEVTSSDLQFIVQKCRENLTPESFWFIRNLLAGIK